MDLDIFILDTGEMDTKLVGHMLMEHHNLLTDM